MNRFRAFAVIPLFALTACHIRTAQPGDLTFLWTFAGQSCSQAGVQTVHIDIPGEVLANNGDFDCTTAGTDGIVLHDFVPGNYSFSIAGYDSTNLKLFEGGGTITVDGSVNIPVDLAYVVGGMAIDPELEDSQGNIVDCSASPGHAAVTFTVDVLDRSGNEVFGGVDLGPGNAGYPCGTVISYSTLSPEVYSVVVYGYESGSQTPDYQSDSDPIQVTAGVFPTSANATLVPLFTVQ